MTNESGIYKITNLVNGKYYIGSAVNINRRWSEHKRKLSNNKHHSIHLQRAWNIYGEDNFKFEVLFNCSKEELIHYEQLYFGEFKPEYNICKVAGSPLGRKHSEQSKKKMSLILIGHTRNKGIAHSEEHNAKISAANKGKVVSKETKFKISIANKGKKRSEETIAKLRERVHTDKSKAKMSVSAKNNPNLYWKNKNLSDKHKEKISKSHIGKTVSEETKVKMSASKIGHVVSDETRLKLKESNKGKKRSEETRNKISIAGKGRFASEGTRLKRSLSMKRTLSIKHIINNWGCAL
jgi:group I intron endonuclease